MTHDNEFFDWQAALSDDLAHALAHGAECALTDAASNVEAMSPGEHALVGIGFAVLAVRAQLAQTSSDVADQLSAMADDMRELTETITAVRRPWWRRLTSRFRPRIRLSAPRSEVSGNEGQAAAPGSVEAGTAAPRLASVTPLHRDGGRS
ncbi:hypothetical protein [Actinomadura litoris]|uniref:Uncharacterized protein n=1 Tax=Actinomadura litoris TaxID=2678616 RepID=A0A7K1L2W2_9ACTN|nr:hypothetical protein [Actinomadura litoris]MUN38727.1 hypothetical protein [Actinomadura litoris]